MSKTRIKLAMSLPKRWWLDRKLSDIFTQRQIKLMKSYRLPLESWTKTICELRGMGLAPKEAIYRANCKFVRHIRKDAGIPDDMVWNGIQNVDDSECNCCAFLYKAGLISTPGRMRYLGNYWAGTIAVTKTKWIEDYDYTEDVEVSDILAAYRCEICGNEATAD